MNEGKNPKHYDLEDRTFKFASDVRNFIRSLPKTISNIEDGKQVIRSSGSVGANYIEANESISRKDFFLRIKICRKEAKESKYWLLLINVGGYRQLILERKRLTNEAIELMKIFSSIMRSSKEVL